jgi:hypothetical protein
VPPISAFYYWLKVLRGLRGLLLSNIVEKVINIIKI